MLRISINNSGGSLEPKGARTACGFRSPGRVPRRRPHPEPKVQLRPHGDSLAFQAQEPLALPYGDPQTPPHARCPSPVPWNTRLRRAAGTWCTNVPQGHRCAPSNDARSRCIPERPSRPGILQASRQSLPPSRSCPRTSVSGSRPLRFRAQAIRARFGLGRKGTGSACSRTGSKALRSRRFRRARVVFPGCSAILPFRVLPSGIPTARQASSAFEVRPSGPSGADPRERIYSAATLVLKQAARRRFVKETAAPEPMALPPHWTAIWRRGMRVP